MSSVDLYCPGPSLAVHLKLRTAVSDVSVGINAALLVEPADWWVFGDVEVLDLWPTIEPRVGVFHQTAKQRLPPWSAHKLAMHWDDVRCDPRRPYSLPWNLSMVAAMGLISRISPRATVHVYGADWNGTGHCAPGPETTNDRWADERRIVTATADHYGLHVIRYTMHNKIRNRLAADPLTRQPPPTPEPPPAAKPIEWQPAQTVTVPLRRVLCPKCNSPRTSIYKTIPGDGIDYMRCGKCGEKFASHAASSRIRLLSNHPR